MGLEEWLRTHEAAVTPASVGVAEAKRRLDGGAVVLVDVREPNEWRAGHVLGAVHIPLGDLPARAASLPRDRPVLVMCHSGHRSAKATILLRALGLPMVTNVEGGVLAWVAHGLPLCEGDTPDTRGI